MSTDKATCPTCCSDHNEPLPARYLDGKLLQCLACGLRFVYPKPSLEELAKIYDDTYYRTTDPGRRGYEDYEADQENLLRTFRGRMKRITNANSQPGRLLDVGCAHGFFLQSAAEAGWDVYGLDISAQAIERASESFGDQVVQGQFPDADFPSNHFQIITMWDYLEHTLDPRAEVQKANELLTDDGTLVVYTPELGSLPSRLLGHRWMHYKAEHLLYFTRDALRRLLEEMGFRIVSIRYAGKHVSLAFFLRRLNLYLPAAERLFHRLLSVRRVHSLSLYVNPFDFMLVRAKKVGPAGERPAPARTSGSVSARSGQAAE